jgi:hypothetical protein
MIVSKLYKNISDSFYAMRGYSDRESSLVSWLKPKFEFLVLEIEKTDVWSWNVSVKILLCHVPVVGWIRLNELDSQCFEELNGNNY